MRSFRHWTPRYLINRAARIAYEYRHPEAPWLTATSVQVLESWLRPEDRGLEWGSGRSTLWLGMRLKALMSIEHDQVWYSRTRSELAARELRNVDLRFCPDDASYLDAV